MKTRAIPEPDAMHAQLDALDQTLDDLERRIAERTADLGLLYDVTSAANRATSVQEAFRFALRHIAKHMGWVFGQVFFPFDRDPSVMIPADVFYESGNGRFDQLRSMTLKSPVRKGDGIVGRVYASGQPEWVANVADHSFEARLGGVQDQNAVMRTAAAFPVMVGKQVGAVLEFLAETDIPPKETLLHVMEQIGVQLGRVLERNRVERRIADSIDEHRRTIGVEMHEGVAQQLTGAMLMAEDLRRQLAAEILPSAATAGRLVECVQEAQRQVCQLSRGLLPVEIDAHGLMSALEELCATVMSESGIETRFECRGTVPVDDNVVATHLYHIAQEAVRNAVEHSRARTIIATLEEADHRLRISVQDNGIGLPAGFEEGDGLGFRVMHYRSTLVGGQLFVSSERGFGTTITCELRQDQFPK